MSKIDHSLFNAQAHALEDAFGTCPQCQSKLTVKRAKSGAFLGCSGYPDCDFTKALQGAEISDVKQIDGSRCPQCEAPLTIKKGRYGLFIGCSNFPECQHIAPIRQQNDTQVACPSCHQGQLVKRINKYGKSFFACDRFPKCRYAVNQPPVAHSCPTCGWPIMLEKRHAPGRRLVCPQRTCHQSLDISSKD